MIDRIVDRAGFVWADLSWDGTRLTSLRVPGAVVDGAVIDDPLLGPAHRITSGDAVTAMTAIDWANPTRIPTVADPAALAAGAGAMILNVIALLAQGPCRYAGRYPTSALFRTLARSFRTTATEDDFTSHFRLVGPEVEIPIDFTPAPFERVGNVHGFVELRDGTIQRAVIDRVSYEPGGSPARLVSIPLVDHGLAPVTSRARAELWFGDATYAHVATFADDGTLVEGPHPLPRCTSAVIGRNFPPALVGALAELIADAVPAPLAEDARRFVTGRVITWADLGAQAAANSAEGLAVHAALWEHVAPHGLGRLALALAEALAPIVTRTLVRAIARDVEAWSPRA